MKYLLFLFKMYALLQGCMSQNDDVMSQASFNLETEMGEPTVAQLLAFTNGNAVRWPKVILTFNFFYCYWLKPQILSTVCYPVKKCIILILQKSLKSACYYLHMIFAVVS